MEIANVARACGLSGFRYLSFPPRHFPPRLATLPPCAELEISIGRDAAPPDAIPPDAIPPDAIPPDAIPPPAPRFHLISELIDAIETQLAPPAIAAAAVAPAFVARSAKRVARRAARPASSLVPKR